MYSYIRACMSMNSGGLLDPIDRESFDTLIHCIIVQNCDTTLIVMPIAQCCLVFFFL